MPSTRFERDATKDRENQAEHGVAFADPRRAIAQDLSHSSVERRYSCFGWVDGGMLSVRFTCRKGTIRIFGAGYWRKGKRIYEQENQTHE
ncbi:MAG TPA: BrnT family toxin [Candidatus Hydrogenedentes bacterium]|nr:BrnT family toxin [Candidatus Hydrogenedentota bacterium]